MKVGDIVRLKRSYTRGHPSFRKGTRLGIMVDIIQRKCWRTHEQGKKIDWNVIDPEPHAVVMYADVTMHIPVVDLEVVNESR